MLTSPQGVSFQAIDPVKVNAGGGWVEESGKMVRSLMRSTRYKDVYVKKVVLKRWNFLLRDQPDQL